MGCMGPMRAKSTFTRRWVKNLHTLLDGQLSQLENHAQSPTAEKYPLRWADVGRKTAVPSMEAELNENSGLKYFRFILKKILSMSKIENTKNVKFPSFLFFSIDGVSTFGQLVTSNIDATSTKASDDLVFFQTELLMYHGSTIPWKIKTISSQHLLQSTFLIAKLIR